MDEPIEVPVGTMLEIRSIYDAHPPRYSLDGYYTPADGVEYAHVGVMGYARLRWVDMNAFETVRARAGSADLSSANSAAGGMSAAKLAQLLLQLDLTPTQQQQLQSALAK